MNKTGHLAWCALIALHTAREDGTVSSESQENLFITRWFALAKKHRRFTRDVATDIDWILNQGRTQGGRARLRNKLDYLWRSCSGELREQNDLFRLTYALELATQHNWVYQVLNDTQWSGRRQVRLILGVNSIFVLKSALDSGFCNDGNQLGVSLDIENYCTLRLFFDLSTLAGLSRRNLPEAGIRLLFQI